MLGCLGTDFKMKLIIVISIMFKKKLALIKALKLRYYNN